MTLVLKGMPARVCGQCGEARHRARGAFDVQRLCPQARAALPSGPINAARYG